MKHYKVKPLDNNRGYYITTRQTFNTLEDLVAGYSTAECKGLCCQITRFDQIKTQSKNSVVLRVTTIKVIDYFSILAAFQFD